MTTTLAGVETFRFAKFGIRLKPKEPLFLPTYLGSTLRGGFGHSFRRVVCAIKDADCAACLLRKTCVYDYVFNSPPPPDAKVLSKVHTAPHPFVIEPPLEEKRIYEEGENLTFNLILIGRAIDYLPYFIYSFDELGRIGIGRQKGRFDLEEIMSFDGGGPGRQIYSGKERKLLNSYHVINIPEIIAQSASLPIRDRVTLNFLTPTRIKHEGRLSTEIEFHLILKNLLRRIWLLSYFHCNGGPRLDVRELLERAKGVITEESDLDWKDWERYSNRQKTSMLLGGFKGRITFRGDMAESLPFLLLGTYIHVGKGATFGLGQYRIE